MWKGEYRGRDVAVKVIRIYSNSDLQKIVGVGFCSCSLSRVCTLTMLRVEILQGSRDLEKSPASECTAPNRSDDVRDSVRNGIRLDGEWKRQ